ncbi:MAG TPA: hypothetical protein VH394_29710 [Thermoanaerobaculia bacterium]|jgi:hypothetical protein|nr:hypothetical protein [Thermoanaerobaculia bacterium]
MSERNEVLEEMVRLHASLVKMLSPLQARKDPDAPKSTEDKLREFLWSSLREADVLLDDLLMPKGLDLSREDEGTARGIEELAVWTFFSPHPAGDPWEILLPEFPPEQGDLKVYYMHGRWFCTWLKLDEDTSRPEKRRAGAARGEKGRRWPDCLRPRLRRERPNLQAVGRSKREPGG